MISPMASPDQISLLIVNELAAGEKGVLSLVVAVRRTLGMSGALKGDLSQMVKSSLRKLVASRAVVDDDGRYSLSPRK
jgi:hypothetical protein